MSNPPAPRLPPPNDADDRWKYAVGAVVAIILALCLGVIQGLAS